MSKGDTQRPMDRDKWSRGYDRIFNRSESMTFSEKLQDIKEHPERHRHDFAGLHACCIVDGAVDLALMDAHNRVGLGTNGGQRCDVTSGPCACGAWH